VAKQMHTITIDGRETTVERDTLLVQACRKMGIYVPTLCYNDNLKPYGVCRICGVEVKDGDRTKLVTSCAYEIRKDGLEVTTDNERIRNNRKWIVQFLLARCENEPVVQNLAKQFGVELNPRLNKRDDDCILCGMCVRTCHEIVGVGAIAYEGRGIEREVTSPWRTENDACIACGSCVYVCPTGCIHMTDEDGVRTISRFEGEREMIVRQTKMKTCDKCGNYFVPAALTEMFKKRMDIEPETFVCPDCR
jgi:bidirectional [NiFe] hydrogenase diaphorase subunit